jgi:membrane associated rhomboid family serine protease
MTRLNYPFLTTLVIPIGFALVVLFSPPYQRWTKVASLIGCAAGIAWFVITLFQPRLSLERYPFLWSVSIKQTLAGIFVGIVISVTLARSIKSPRDHGTPKV